MFEGIQRNLSEALKKLRGRGRITEANIREAMQDVRKALLDADVNYTVANDFVQRVTERSVGQDVLRTLDPSEQIFKIVYDELVALMGPVDPGFHFAKDRPTVLMLCGLQGQGKTTTAGKLALTLRERGRKPLLVAADLQRPAAVDQLQVLGEQIGVPVYSETPPANPVEVCRNAVAHAKKSLLDTVILDTAGRLHIDEMPMDELRQIDRQCRPDQVYLVCDAMTGQDAVNSAKAFNEALDLNGVILTKMDGDARGGAALSIKSVAQVPIKFIGVGEKLDRLEEFRPEGMAQRILGQGDILSLVEKVASVQAKLTDEERLEQQQQAGEGRFHARRLSQAVCPAQADGADEGPARQHAGHERDDPGGRGSRIGDEAHPGHHRFDDEGGASQSGRHRHWPSSPHRRRQRHRAARDQAISHAVRAGAHLMRQMAQMSIWERIKMVTGMGKMGAFQPGAKLFHKKGDTGHRKSPKERARERKNKRKKR